MFARPALSFANQLGSIRLPHRAAVCRKLRSAETCMMSERRGVKRKAADTRSSRRPAPSAQPAAGAANTPELVTSVHDTLSAIGDPVHAEQAERYMKGVAPCFGIYAAARRAAVKPIVDKFLASASGEAVVQFVDGLWACPQRDMHYVAMDVLKKTQRVWAVADSADGDAEALLQCLVRCARDRPWWDTIDILSIQGFGPLHLAQPVVCRPLMTEWSDSEDMWERRVSILFQLLFKRATDEEFLFEAIRKACMSSLQNEFFIQKAIGWALRTYRRTAPAAVDRFIEAEERRLSKLSLREARR